MKNKFFYLAVILFSAMVLTSCASRKYGCPNTTGVKFQNATTAQAAV